MNHELLPIQIIQKQHVTVLTNTSTKKEKSQKEKHNGEGIPEFDRN